MLHQVFRTSANVYAPGEQHPDTLYIMGGSKTNSTHARRTEVQDSFPGVPKRDVVEDSFPGVPKRDVAKDSLPEVPQTDGVEDSFPLVPRDEDDTEGKAHDSFPFVP